MIDDEKIGGMVAYHLDHMKAAFKHPETIRIGLYLGHKDDPAGGYFVGNMEPDELVACLQLIMMDSVRLGTVNRDGEITRDG